MVASARARASCCSSVVPRGAGAAEDRGAFRIIDRGPGRRRLRLHRQRRCSKVEKMLAPHDRRGRADPARQHARAGRLRRQRGDAHRPGDRVPAGLGRARRDDGRGRRAAARRARRDARRARVAAGPRRPGARRAGSRSRSCSAARTTRSSRMARPDAGAHGGEPGPARRRFRLQGNAAADARRDRPRARRRPRRLDRGDRHARSRR